jgi:hypothetical protein
VPLNPSTPQENERKRPLGEAAVFEAVRSISGMVASVQAYSFLRRSMVFALMKVRLLIRVFFFVCLF